MSTTTTRGAAWADAVRDEWDLLPDADALVGEVARLIDRADWLDETVSALPSPIVETKSGPKTHPSIVEYRSTFAALQRALASLGLEGPSS